MNKKIISKWSKKIDRMISEMDYPDENIKRFFEELNGQEMNEVVDYLKYYYESNLKPKITRSAPRKAPCAKPKKRKAAP